mmetsp:Transcript_61455/g.70461  ORF Transcript_61455/g.70461 Transcript_61455/m.70461 type:complete len:229 (+) Transcript_61455:44-730(+)
MSGGTSVPLRRSKLVGRRYLKLPPLNRFLGPLNFSLRFGVAIWLCWEVLIGILAVMASFGFDLLNKRSKNYLDTSFLTFSWIYIPRMAQILGLFFVSVAFRGYRHLDVKDTKTYYTWTIIRLMTIYIPPIFSETFYCHIERGNDDICPQLAADSLKLIPSFVFNFYFLWVLSSYYEHLAQGRIDQVMRPLRAQHQTSQDCEEEGQSSNSSVVRLRQSEKLPRSHVIDL